MEIRSEIRATEGGAGVILARYLEASGLPDVGSELLNLVEHSQEIDELLCSSDLLVVSNLREFILSLK